MAPDPQALLDALNAASQGLDATLGLKLTVAEPEQVVGVLEVGPQHLQPYGLVHGGVYCAMVETLCSIAAAINVMAEGKNAVGLENSTSFLKAVRQGTLRGVATPLTRGRRSHVWEVKIYGNAPEQVVATGRVRMLILDPGSSAAGQAIGLADNKG